MRHEITPTMTARELLRIAFETYAEDKLVACRKGSVMHRRLQHSFMAGGHAVACFIEHAQGGSNCVSIAIQRAALAWMAQLFFLAKERLKNRPLKRPKKRKSKATDCIGIFIKDAKHLNVHLPPGMRSSVKAHVKRFGYPSLSAFARTAMSASLESNPAAMKQHKSVAAWVRAALNSYMGADNMMMDADNAAMEASQRP